MNLVQAERSRLCIFAYGEGRKTDRDKLEQEDMEANTCHLNLQRLVSIAHYGSSTSFLDRHPPWKLICVEMASKYEVDYEVNILWFLVQYSELRLSLSI